MERFNHASKILDVKGYNIDTSRLVGRGSFGKVYEAFRDGNTYAAKVIDYTQYPKTSVKESAQVLKNINHQNIVKAYCTKFSDGRLFVIMELCSYGDMHRFMEQQVPKTKIKVQIMVQLGKAVEYLHSIDVIHRDIKPDNILVLSIDGDGIPVVKLSDFGLAEYLNKDRDTSQMSSDCGTPFYKAPEFWVADEHGKLCYTRSVDIFASGLTNLALLQFRNTKDKLHPKIEGSLHPSERIFPVGQVMTNRQQYQTNNTVQTSVNITYANNPEDSDITRAVKSVIIRMTEPDAISRLTAPEVVVEFTDILQNFTESIDEESVTDSEQNIVYTLNQGVVPMEESSQDLSGFTDYESRDDNSEYDAADIEFVSRKCWDAKEPKCTEHLTLPVPVVLIHHTAGRQCITLKEGSSNTRTLQAMHMWDFGWDDLAYSFLVDDSGRIYEGRGWTYVGAHTCGYNKIAVSFAFMGNFTQEAPPEQALNSVKKIIQHGVNKGFISSDYSLHGHRDASMVVSPGDALYEIIQTWPNWHKYPLSKWKI